MKRETISFFGLNENIEGSQQEKWIERRKRLAVRKYGPLKDEIPPPRTVKDSFARSYQQVRADAKYTRARAVQAPPQILAVLLNRTTTVT